MWKPSTQTASTHNRRQTYRHACRTESLGMEIEGFHHSGGSHFHKLRPRKRSTTHRLRHGGPLLKSAPPSEVAGRHLLTGYFVAAAHPAEVRVKERPSPGHRKDFAMEISATSSKALTPQSPIPHRPPSASHHWLEAMADYDELPLPRHIAFRCSPVPHLQLAELLRRELHRSVMVPSSERASTTIPPVYAKS